MAGKSETVSLVDHQKLGFPLGPQTRPHRVPLAPRPECRVVGDGCDGCTVQR